MATLREDIADLQSRLDDAERTATELPHREKYLRLAIGFLRRLLDLQLDLVDDVGRELKLSQKSAPRAERAATKSSLGRSRLQPHPRP